MDIRILGEKSSIFNQFMLEMRDEKIQKDKMRFRKNLERAGEICAFEEILENIWGWSYRESTQYVHVYISRLRRKIEPDPEHPRYLLTEHHIGYRFNRHNAAAIDNAA